MAWHDNWQNADADARPFPAPAAPAPEPANWDYRRSSGAMPVVGLIAAASFLWFISGMLFWGMIALFTAAGETSYGIRGPEDNSWLILPGLIAFALGVLCWVGAVYVGVKAIYQILEFYAELSAIELIRRWRAANAADAAAGSQNTPGEG